ncbi:helix-turn-helix domain-containing protein [Solihabitans fulvus]|uniref:Helix-turn-helix domain-containing protein n=1 Tax=Solihabitans fulvus TaxID=1892852 RepID=A0A5B2X8Y8_9PSEU|nr:helix-turn-helix transcriptional regulator [Solihabitans fulvus]KAA2259509.1 helix-turn-helix domain-containing protein [Solihabitans fulvus]
MGEALQTIPRRLLGGELKRLRQQAGRSQAEVGRAIGRDHTRINKVEVGRSNLTPEELVALLDFLGANEADRTKVLDFGVEARKRQPKQRAYVDQLPGSYRRIWTMESQASGISAYEKGIFPGLLQCADYAEALVAAGDGLWWDSSYQERVSRVNFRLDRQRSVFEVEPAKDLEFIFSDDALATEFGSPQVMRRQFEHMLRITEEHPKISIRVISATARNSPAPYAGFTLLCFENPTPPVGFMSVALGPSPYLDGSADTEALGRVFVRLREMAASQAESRGLVEDALKRS